MKSMTAIYVSSTHGSCLTPDILHSLRYRVSGFLCTSSIGLCSPSNSKSLAIAGPTFGISSNILTSFAVLAFTSEV